MPTSGCGAPVAVTEEPPPSAEAETRSSFAEQLTVAPVVLADFGDAPKSTHVAGVYGQLTFALARSAPVLDWSLSLAMADALASAPSSVSLPRYAASISRVPLPMTSSCVRLNGTTLNCRLRIPPTCR